jgi:hypothetical protein
MSNEHKSADSGKKASQELIRAANQRWFGHSDAPEVSEKQAKESTDHRAPSFQELIRAANKRWFGHSDAPGPGR